MLIRSLALICALSTVFCLAPGNAAAGEIGKGSLELALGGGFEHRNLADIDAHLTNFDIGTRLTYSVTSLVGVGGTIAFTHSSWSYGRDETAIGAAADLILNFSTSSSIVPFGQLSIGLTDWSGDPHEDAEMGFTLPFVGVGFRTLLGDHASVNVVGGYRYQKNFLGFKDINSHDIVLSFGMSVFPGGIR